MSQQTFTCTTDQFAEIQGVPYPEAYGLMCFLRARGVAKEAGKIVSPLSKTGKGKRVTLWELPIELHLDFIYRPEEGVSTGTEK